MLSVARYTSSQGAIAIPRCSKTKVTLYVCSYYSSYLTRSANDAMKMQYWAVNERTNSAPMTTGPNRSSYGPGDRFKIISERLPSVGSSSNHTKEIMECLFQQQVRIETEKSNENKKYWEIIRATMHSLVPPLTLYH